MEFLRKLGQQVGQVWLSLSLGRRIALGLAGGLCLLVVGAVWYWAAQTEYAVLFANLGAEEAGSVTAKLQAQNVPFRLTAGGTTVMVPADQVYQRRIDLAVDGLPGKGGKGFELFDSTSLGMTPFTQHVNYIRALQAELAKTIMHIDPIVFARVHVVRPDPSPFIREQKPTTASVFLRLRPGAVLGRKAAAGIVAFVARSVEGLNANHVTLVDDQGQELTNPNAAETGFISTQMDYRKEIEGHLAAKAESLLANVVGPGKAIVKVTADINFQRSHEKKETYSPEKFVTSETIKSSKTTSGSAASRAAVGVTSNIGKSAAGDGVGAKSVDETITTEFALSKTTQEFEDKAGTIERLTVSALVDLSAIESGKNAAGSPFTLNDAREIIKQAVGFKGTRDQIEVRNVKLTPAVPTAPEGEPETGVNWQQIISLVRNGSLGLAALVALTLGWTALRQFRAAAAATRKASATAATGPAAVRLPQTFQQDPEAIAKVLASWLEQSESQRKAAA